jgi:hypothetical protein
VDTLIFAFIVRKTGYNFCARFAPQSCHARDGPKQMGFEEEATESPDRECIPRGFPRNLLFVRGVGREELREDPSGDDDGEGFLRCMFVVGFTG